jgi:hypothetical protein
MRANQPHQSLSRKLLKHHDHVHSPQASQNCGPIGGWQDWATWTLQLANRLIAIETHKKHIPQATSAD